MAREAGVLPRNVWLLLLVVLCASWLAGGSRGSRISRHSSEAVVMTYVEPTDDKDREDLWNGLRTMLNWLLHDIDRCTCADVVVMVSDNVPEEKLRYIEESGAIVHRLVNPGVTFRRGHADRWVFTWGKLMVMNLTQYSRVIAIDTDMVLLDRLDRIFHWASLRLPASCSVGAVDDREDIRDHPIFNSGLTLLHPSRSDMQGILTMLQEAKVNYTGDQDVLNDYFHLEGRRRCRIPKIFHRFPSYRYPERNETVAPETVAVHGAAWRNNLHPIMMQVWQQGLDAANTRDKLRTLYATFDKVLPLRPCLAQCTKLLRSS